MAEDFLSLLLVRMSAFLSLLLGDLVLERRLRAQSVLLMLLLSVIIPLPAVKCVTSLLEKASVNNVLLFRIYYRVIGIYWKLITSTLRVLLIPVGKIVSTVVFYWLNEYCRFIVNTIRSFYFVFLHLLFCISNAPPWVFKLFAIITLPISFPLAVFIRYCSLVQQLVSVLLLSQLGWLLTCMENVAPISLLMQSFHSGAYSVLFDTTTSLAGLAIFLPGSSAVITYLISGNLNLGSTIDFWPCRTENPAFSSSPTCTVISLVQELSYSAVTLVQTTALYRYSGCGSSIDWKQTLDFIKNRIKFWLPHARLMAAGILTPFVLGSFCPIKVINSAICITSNLAFLIILNMHTSASMVLYYCGICMVGSHMVNIIVASVSLCNTVKLAAHSFVVNAWCIVAICLTVQLSIQTCIQIISKLLQPPSDIFLKANDESI